MGVYWNKAYIIQIITFKLLLIGNTKGNVESNSGDAINQNERQLFENPRPNSNFEMKERYVVWP